MKSSKRFLALLLAFLLAFGNMSSVVAAAAEGTDAVVLAEEVSAEPVETVIDETAPAESEPASEPAETQEEAVAPAEPEAAPEGEQEPQAGSVSDPEAEAEAPADGGGVL